MKAWVRLGFFLLLAGANFDPLYAAQSSASYGLSQFILESVGNTQAGAGRQILNSGGEPLVGQSWSRNLSIQAGYFNEYFMPPPTPTVTCTPIRTFGGELLSVDYVYAAPNPIRGNRANIVFHLAESAEVELKIFTVSSDLVISKRWDNAPAGENHWYWNTTGIANGVYLLWIKAKGHSGTITKVTKKIAFIR